jgi:hypothetical protein
MHAGIPLSTCKLCVEGGLSLSSFVLMNKQALVGFLSTPQYHLFIFLPHLFLKNNMATI